MAHSYDPAPNRRRREVKLAADIRGCAIVEVVQFEDASVESAKSTQEFGGRQSLLEALEVVEIQAKPPP